MTASLYGQHRNDCQCLIVTQQLAVKTKLRKRRTNVGRVQHNSRNEVHPKVRHNICNRGISRAGSAGRDPPPRSKELKYCKVWYTGELACHTTVDNGLHGTCRCLSRDAFLNCTSVNKEKVRNRIASRANDKATINSKASSSLKRQTLFWQHLPATSCHAISSRYVWSWL